MTKKKSNFEATLDALFYYFERKYRTSKLYRFVIKAYGYLAMVAIMLAVSAIDFHPVGALLWIVRVPIFFVVLNMAILALDLVGYTAYEILRDIYDPVRVKERRQKKAQKKQQQRQRQYSKRAA